MSVWDDFIQRLEQNLAECSHGSGTPGLSMQKGGRDVVPIPDAKLAGMARAHSVAAVVIDATDQ